MFIDLTLSLPIDHPIFALADVDVSSPLAMGHVGTHLDTCIGRPIPVDWCARRAVLVDVQAYGPVVPLEAIADADIREGDFVLFRTGFMDIHPYGSRPYFKEHPQLAWDLIQALLDRQVSFIGIDAAGIRHGVKLGDEHHQADVMCEEAGCYVIENLANVATLPDSARAGFDIRLGWIAHRGASGIPVKVVAEL